MISRWKWNFPRIFYREFSEWKRIFITFLVSTVHFLFVWFFLNGNGFTRNKGLANFVPDSKAGLSIFFNTSTSLFMGGTFVKFEQFSWISYTTLKSGGTKDHFRQVKILGPVPYLKACSKDNEYVMCRHHFRKVVLIYLMYSIQVKRKKTCTLIITYPLGYNSLLDGSFRVMK